MVSSQRKPSFPSPSPTQSTVLKPSQPPSCNLDSSSITPLPPPLQPPSTAFQHRINDESFHSATPPPHSAWIRMSSAGAASSPSPSPRPAPYSGTDCPSCSTLTTYRALVARRQAEEALKTQVYGGERVSVTLSILCKHGRLLHRFSAVSDWGAAMRGRDDGGEILCGEIRDEQGEVEMLEGVVCVEGVGGEGRRFWVCAKERGGWERRGGIGGYVRAGRATAEVQVDREIDDGESADENTDENTESFHVPKLLIGRIVDDGTPPVLDHHPDHHYKLRRSGAIDPNNNDDADYIDHSKTSPSSLKDKEKTMTAHSQTTTSTALDDPLNESTTAQRLDHAPQPLDLPTNLSARFRNYMLHGPPSAPYAISCVGDGEALDFQGLMRGVEAVSGSAQKQDGEGGDEGEEREMRGRGYMCGHR